LILKDYSYVVKMSKVQIQKYQPGQETLIYQLIKKVYDEFVSGDYSEEGNQVFYDWIKPSAIAERQKNRINLWVAFEGLEMVGMIEIRENKNITLLFVDKAFQGQGIARELFQETLKECIRRDPKLDTFYVHASPFSIPVYRKLGFVETDSMQEESGIKYLPMEMKLQDKISFET
jgi:GNAT superfamily N-acetyltransferase